MVLKELALAADIEDSGGDTGELASRGVLTRPHVVVTPTHVDLVDRDNATNPIDRIDVTDRDCTLLTDPTGDFGHPDALAPTCPGGAVDGREGEGRRC
jgi:hypothetical protein